jgi:hypothetical protein
LEENIVEQEQLKTEMEEWHLKFEEAEQQRFLLNDDNMRLNADLVSLASKNIDHCVITA